ncbi:hypothetical protein AEU44_21105, partial [Salmonella enterica subsp. enterica serovar Kentucky]
PGTAFSRLKKRPRQNPARPLFSTFRPSPDGWFFYDETRLQDALSGGYCPVEALTGLYLLFLLSLISDFPLLFQVVLVCSAVSDSSE